MQDLFQKRPGIAVRTDPAGIFPLQFDFIYFQHQSAGLFRYGETIEDRPASRIIFGRLSRRLWGKRRMGLRQCWATTASPIPS